MLGKGRAMEAGRSRTFWSSCALGQRPLRTAHSEVRRRQAVSLDTGLGEGSWR